MNAHQVHAELVELGRRYTHLPSADEGVRAAMERTEWIYRFLVELLAKHDGKVPGVDTAALLGWMEARPAGSRERIWRRLGRQDPYLPSDLVVGWMARELRRGRGQTFDGMKLMRAVVAAWKEQVVLPAHDDVLRTMVHQAIQRVWPLLKSPAEIEWGDLSWIAALKKDDPQLHGLIDRAGPGRWKELLTLWRVEPWEESGVNLWLTQYAADGAEGYLLMKARAASPAEDLDALAARLGLEHRARRPRGGVTAGAVEGPAVVVTEAPMENESAAARTRANLAAMELAARKTASEMTAADQLVLRRYSGWGGLSIEKAKDKFPDGFPVPDERGLIHEFYTPSVVCKAVAALIAPRLQGLAEEGVVLALEPAAGIGRFIAEMTGPGWESVRWTAVEYSEISARMLSASAAGLSVFTGPFERWVRENEEGMRGRIGLVVSNPPYGQRGASTTEDPDRSYRERNAYAYFLRRSLDLLGPGGLGIYLIPAGFMHGTGALIRALREKVLLRHHLAVAFRLPSGIFPGAHLVTDLVVFRARGGTLDGVSELDQSILDGQYFKDFPHHILGKEVGKDEEGEDDQTKKPRFGYQVVGTFTGLPDFAERPMCNTCTVHPDAKRGGKGRARTAAFVGREEGAADEDLKAEYAVAAQLGMRVDAYLALVAKADSATPAQLWPELVAALNAWRETYGNPWQHGIVRMAHERSHRPLQRFLAAWEKSGPLTAALARKPVFEPRYEGGAQDVAAQATHLFRTKHTGLTMADLARWHQSRGGQLGLPAIRAALLSAGWAFDGPKGEDLFPAEDYYSGSLWPKYDRARARAESGDVVAAEQAKKLLLAIKPVVFAEIEGISARDGWLPLETIQDWLNRAVQGNYSALSLERKEGLLSVRGVQYDDIDDDRSLSYATRMYLGWANHDYTVFYPRKQSREDNIDAIRLEFARQLNENFSKWLGSQPEHQRLIEAAYNRNYRGWVQPTYEARELPIARWTKGGVVLKPHQVAGARRVLAHRSGLLAFDVGVGKTYTGIAIIARARQEGWVKRPVIVVPNSIIWKWAADIKRVLPDYRVAIIGSSKKIMSRGPNKGKLTSELDSPAERAAKWTAFQGGEYDVALVTYSALPRTRLREESVIRYAEHTEAIEREVKLRQRNAKKKSQGKKGKEALTEREAAILREGVAAWVAEQMELPEAMEYDPGVVWDDIGIDLMVIDEAQNFKNLYLPEEREGGVPRYMGSEGEGSKRAWQLDFRLNAVRQLTGGSGVVLLSATPAKNSPLEFFNLIQYLAHDIWSQCGIRNSEEFIDFFCEIEPRYVFSPDGRALLKSACIGFKNLDILREIIFRYGEFKTAEDVGLILPEPTVHQVWVDMDAEQESKTSFLRAELKEAKKKAASGGGAKHAVLGLMARLAMVAVSSRLDEGPDWKSALSAAFEGYASPKLRAVAENVLKNRVCGHIVFCDNIAVHRWMVEILVDAGVPRDRIAVLNGVTAKAPAERQKLAEQFNGNEEDGVAPLYDVIICNAVAYEGIDLQQRTCAIHHIDLPWEPATLQQRNGRGVRQGNKLSAIAIYYYLSNRSMDGMRFGMIKGKHGWMVTLLKSMDRATNNPAAQMELDDDALRIMLSSDPDAERAAIDAEKAKAKSANVGRLQRDASSLLMGLNGRFRRLETVTDATERAAMVEAVEKKYQYLALFDASIWPWAAWLPVVRHSPILVPPAGQMFAYQGLRTRVPKRFSGFVEFGQVLGDDRVGIRDARLGAWNLMSREQLGDLGISPSDLEPSDWPADDEEYASKHLNGLLTEELRYSGDWPKLAWYAAPDAWRAKAWSQHSSRITELLATTDYYAQDPQAIPVQNEVGLFIVKGNQVSGRVLIPPTDAGFERFVKAVASQKTYKWGEANRAAEYWWHRKLPFSGKEGT